MAHSLYSAYAHVFYQQKASLGDLDAVLDSVDGFAPRLREACQKASVAQYSLKLHSQTSFIVSMMPSPANGILTCSQMI